MLYSISYSLISTQFFRPLVIDLDFGPPPLLYLNFSFPLFAFPFGRNTLKSKTDPKFKTSYIVFEYDVNASFSALLTHRKFFKCAKYF